MTLAAVAPLVLVQVASYVVWFLSQRAEGLAADREMARAVAAAFKAYIRDVYRQEGVLGRALAGLRGHSVEEASDYLRRSANEYATIQSWHWLSPEGRVIASSDSRAIGVNLADRAYFRELLSGREWTVSDLLAAKQSGEPTFVIARRIDGPDGAILGIVVAAVEPHRLGEVSLRIRRAEGGVFTLFDRQGTLVYVHPEAHWHAVHRPWRGEDPLLDAALSSGEETAGVFRSPVDGEMRFSARVPLKESGWVVGASRPVSAAMAWVVRSLWWAAGVNLVVIAVSAGLAALFGRQIIATLADLEEQAQAVGQGRLDRRVEIAGMEEFARLGQAFNLMALRVQERQEAVDKAMAEVVRSNQELEQFAYVASHDLQEPLRVISGYLQLLERRYQGRLDADADQFIQYTVDAVKRLQELITDLLEYSRVGSRGKPLRPTDSGASLRRALAALERVIAETGTRVTHGPLPTVLADPTQLAQLFQNLIDNAIKFRRDCPPEIEVSALREESGWRFSVRDNGIGIEPEYWERIFLIFQRLHTRQKHPGTGIGLAICKRIVERHGGRIWIDSKPGEGSTFHFMLQTAAPQ